MAKNKNEKKSTSAKPAKKASPAKISQKKAASKKSAPSKKAPVKKVAKKSFRPVEVEQEDDLPRVDDVAAFDEDQPSPRDEEA